MRCRAGNVRDCFRYSGRGKRLFETVVAALYPRSRSMSIVSFAWSALQGMARYIESPASGYYMDKGYGSYCPQFLKLPPRPVATLPTVSDKIFAILFALLCISV